MELQEFFTQHPRVALAFSGGVDSSYLLYAGLQWAERLGVYYIKSPFQPEFEYRDALRLAKELGASVTVLSADPLSDAQVAANPANRCYYCKKAIMSTIKAAAARDGFLVYPPGAGLVDKSEFGQDGSDWRNQQKHQPGGEGKKKEEESEFAWHQSVPPSPSTPDLTSASFSCERKAATAFSRSGVDASGSSQKSVTMAQRVMRLRNARSRMLMSILDTWEATRWSLLTK